MKKKKYSKPELRTLKINPSEMCAGSLCTTIDVNIKNIGGRSDITRVIPEGHEGGSWDDEF